MFEQSEIPSEVSLLLRSALFNNIKGIRSALKLGVNVNSSAGDLIAPIHIAAEKGYVEMAYYLVNVKGIDLNKQTLYGNTPLLLSIYHNHFKVTRILLDSGADPNALVRFDQTALHLAASYGRLKSVQQLIQYKADVNVVDCFDRTPLYISLISHPSDVITYILLKAGANPNFKTKLKISLLSLACLGANSMVHVYAITTLIFFGANVRDKNIKQETCLHKAAASGYVPLIDLLVKLQANLYDQNIWGQTPLDIAKLHKNVNAVQVLEELENAYLLEELAPFNC